MRLALDRKGTVSVLSQRSQEILTHALASPVRMRRTPILVAQPTLPDLQLLLPALEKIWSSKVVSNNGPFHRELEYRLAEYLDVPYLSLFSNGTIALLAALRSLDLKGEIITTPYSFVATAHSLLWNHLTPVFVDIDADSLNIAADLIEQAVTPRTSGILPVHVYGQPCDVDKIAKIASKHSLSVIYDAAHAFGVDCDCGSVLQHGDLSVISFHATKVFNTLEGGAVVSSTPELKNRVDKLKNFGFESEVAVSEIGINGKMNEISAAIGLLQLETVDSDIERRSEIAQQYNAHLSKIPGVDIYRPASQLKRYNHAYYPIFITDDHPLSRDGFYEQLKSRGVHGRRYFYPLITDFEAYNRIALPAQDYPVAASAAEKIMCLPMHANLTDEDVEYTIATIKQISSTGC